MRTPHLGGEDLYKDFNLCTLSRPPVVINVTVQQLLERRDQLIILEAFFELQ